MKFEFFISLKKDIWSAVNIKIKTDFDKQLQRERIKTIILRIFGCLSMLIGIYGSGFTISKTRKPFHLISAAFVIITGFDFAMIGKNHADAHFRNVAFPYLYRNTLVAHSIHKVWNNLWNNLL
ncbi:MAG TPA: hypothetical protein PLC42_00960 [Parachlamydiaceae bacterium]|nr:hypothetical protein [Parachlamydiaceae bacterium]